MSKIRSLTAGVVVNSGVLARGCGLMAKVVFTRNIQRHVACPPGEARGGTVRECLETIFAGNPQARGYVLDEHGNLRKHMAVYVNGEAIQDRAGLSDAVTDTCEIYVMQALSGG